MRPSRNYSNVLCLLGTVLSLAACGGSDGGASGSVAGTVTEPWTGFCTATFTEDTQILDFGEPSFTARAGNEYLLSNFDDSFGGRADLVYLTSAGPDSFEVEPSAAETWPFTSNCEIGAGVPYYAVFTNVTVYAEQESATRLCQLSAGTALPAGGSGRGYSFAGALPNGAATYEVILGAFSAQCGQDTGYISVPQTRSFDSTTWLVPIIGIIGPE